MILSKNHYHSFSNRAELAAVYLGILTTIGMINVFRSMLIGITTIIRPMWIFGIDRRTGLPTAMGY